MKYKNIDFKSFKSSRKFGIELEVDGSVSKQKICKLIESLSTKKVMVSRYQQSVNNDYWHVKDDATCGTTVNKNGVEIASFVGKGIEDLRHIATVAGELEKQCQINNRCGFHIHVDASDLNEHHVGILLGYWLKIEKVLQYVLPKHRRNNKFCRFTERRFKVSRKFYSVLKPKDLYLLLSPFDINFYENYDRRFNLNLVNYARAMSYENLNFRKTLELRWPEGTLNSRDIFCWTILFLNFVEVCKNKERVGNLEVSTLDETLLFLGLNHENNCFSLFDPILHDVRVWFLERCIQHGNFAFRKLAKSKLDLISSEQNG
jgi:hypothetical protein